MEKAMFLCVVATAILATVAAIEPCPGDTRDDKRCNHDTTHRVCAKIGVPNTSFWKFTGQNSWCNTRGDYGGEFGNDLRCPESKPSWCICKWATARWIKGQGCDDSVEFICEATDVCNLKRSFKDFDVDLKPAHDCMAKKCKQQWDNCVDCADEFDECGNWAKRGECKCKKHGPWMKRNCMKSCGQCTA